MSIVAHVFSEFDTNRRRVVANLVRELRLSGKSRREIRRIVDGSFFDIPRRPPRPTLGDVWPISRCPGDGLCAVKGDAEYWRAVYLLPGKWEESDIASKLGLTEHYGGPGRSFSNCPVVCFNGISTIVYQSGGLDI